MRYALARLHYLGTEFRDDSPFGDARLPGRRRRDRGSGASALRPAGCRLSDRDRLRARRRRHEWRGGGAALRRQGPAGLQSADRACGRSRGGARRSRASTPMRRRLAEALWPGPLTLVLPKTAGLSRRRTGDGGPRHHRGARARHHAWRRKSCGLSAGRWWRRRPIAPAMSRRRPRRMCSPILPAASI